MYYCLAACTRDTTTHTVSVCTGVVWLVSLCGQCRVCVMRVSVWCVSVSRSVCVCVCVSVCVCVCVNRVASRYSIGSAGSIGSFNCAQWLKKKKYNAWVMTQLSFSVYPPEFSTNLTTHTHWHTVTRYAAASMIHSDTQHPHWHSAQLWKYWFP